MNIQWFPGHMAKTRRLLAENLKLIDVVIELLDARIPRSSKNPEIERIIGNKPRITVLNKSDLADEAISQQWHQWYAMQGIPCLFIDAKSGKGVDRLKAAVKNACEEKIEKERQKGRLGRPVRTMVVGIPNVGKSSLINRMVGKASAMTGDKPGVTRGKQWIRISSDIELLDTPGILWPKFEDPEVGYHLAFTGAIKDDIMDIVELASLLMVTLAKTYPKSIQERYKLSEVEGKEGYFLLEQAGKNRGCMISGGNVDLTRIAAIVLDEFRGGKLGRISLEKPEGEGDSFAGDA